MNADRRMVIEIIGSCFTNKGAELMLLAAAERLRSHFPSMRIVVDENTGPYESRMRHGFYHKFMPGRYGRLGRLIDVLMHAGYRRHYGLVQEREVQVVLSAAGYALGDPFKNRDMSCLAELFNGWRVQGKTIIVLPQAFGPFDRAESRVYARQALGCCDLVFARDEESFSHLKSLGVTDGRFHIAPDFTILLKGIPPADCPVTKDDIILVPNAKMLSQKIDGMDYPAWLAKVAEGVRSRGCHAWLLYHETKKDPAMIAVSEAWKALKVPVIRTRDAIELKGALAQAGAVLASRYHAAISTLSQGVPCLGTSWAHKYAALFDEYGVLEWLIGESSSPDETATRLLQVKAEGPQRVQALRCRALDISRRTEEMWHVVEQMIGRMSAP